MLRIELRRHEFVCEGCWRECRLTFYDNNPTPLYCPFLIRLSTVVNALRGGLIMICHRHLDFLWSLKKSIRYSNSNILDRSINIINRHSNRHRQQQGLFSLKIHRKTRGLIDHSIRINRNFRRYCGECTTRRIDHDLS